MDFVDILLATYNGDEYLMELLKSLEYQTYTNWRLIVADDGSLDSTLDILRKFQSDSSHEVEIHVNQPATGSAKANFIQLFQYVKSPYIMLCDQDDVWLQDKIEKTYRKMLEVECSNPKRIPILVNTDLIVVDQDLAVMDNSFFHYSLFNKSFTLKQQLCMNKVTGCTVMVNHSLVRFLQREAFDVGKITMHDSWLALIALTFGCTGFVDEPLILYRQHEDNSVGAQAARDIHYQLKRFFSGNLLSQDFMAQIIQVEYFVEYYHDELKNNQNQALLEGYAALANRSRSAYRLYCIKNGILKYPFKRAFAQLLYAHK